MSSVTRTAEACHANSSPVPPELQSTPQDRLPWFALYLRQRDRERCEDYLRAHCVELFSPLRAEVRQWSDRKKVVHSPLFPGYLFCRFDPRANSPIIRAPGLIDIVNSGHRYLEVDAQQIEDIRRCVETGAQLEVTSDFVCGQKVRIKSGPLDGIVGILTTFRQKLRVALEISMMNRTLLVEVDYADIGHL